MHGGTEIGDLNGVTGAIVDAAYRIHSELGPGLLESVYERLLARDLARRGLGVERQKSVSFDFESSGSRTRSASTCSSQGAWWSK